MRDIKLPEFSRNRTVDSHNALVFNSPCKYDVILGADFLTKTGIDPFLKAMTSFSSLAMARSFATRFMLRPCRKRALVNPKYFRLLSNKTISDHFHDNSDDPAWNEMNEKSRSLAKLLLGQDHAASVGIGQQEGVDKQEEDQQLRKRRASHVFNRRRGLSQAITMIESQNPAHQRQSNLLLTYLLGHENNHKRKSKSFRLGIAGPPGAGPSSLL